MSFDRSKYFNYKQLILRINDQFHLTEVVAIDEILHGSPPQHYDAYVLFANEDIEFAISTIERIESFDLKVRI